MIAASNLIKFSFMEFFCTSMYGLDLYSSYPTEESVWFLLEHLFLSLPFFFFLQSIDQKENA